jgi:ketosteroid isomerase-like protein
MTGTVLLLAFVLQAVVHDEFAPLREQWARNLHEKRIEASVAEYAADADFIDPTGNRVHGTAALRQLFQTITATYDSDLTFTSLRVEGSGDLTYDSGTYRETLVTRATGKRQESSGSYLTVYRRGKDGGWLIVEQVWTGAPIEASPSAALHWPPIVAATPGRYERIRLTTSHCEQSAFQRRRSVSFCTAAVTLRHHKGIGPFAGYFYKPKENA